MNPWVMWIRFVLWFFSFSLSVLFNLVSKHLKFKFHAKKTNQPTNSYSIALIKIDLEIFCDTHFNLIGMALFTHNWNCKNQLKIIYETEWAANKLPSNNNFTLNAIFEWWQFDENAIIMTHHRFIDRWLIWMHSINLQITLSILIDLFWAYQRCQCESALDFRWKFAKFNSIPLILVCVWMSVFRVYRQKKSHRILHSIFESISLEK